MSSVVGRRTQPGTPRPRPGSSHAVFVEIVAFVGTAIGLLSAIWIALTAQLTFGAPVVVTDDQVRHYWIAVGVLGVSSVLALGAGIYRRARYSPWIHMLLIVAGVVVVLVLFTTEVGTLGSGESESAKRQPANALECNPGGAGYACPGG